MIAYTNWADTYELFEGQTATDIWRLGIAAELGRLGTGVATVLDLGAGTGIGSRVLGETAPGLTVTCLDRSAAMLDCGGVPSERRIVADMADFSVPPGSFDFVVSGFDALNYLPPEPLANCLACVAGGLRPGGHLVFDYRSRKVLAVDWGNLEYEHEKDGHRLHRRHSYEFLFERSRTVLSLYRGDELLWRETHIQHVVDPFRLEEMARGNGLETLLVRNIDSTHFSPAHPTHVYVMRKF